MIRALLNWFGWQLVYRCNWGEYPFRYSNYGWRSLMMSSDPLHPDYAPPWARMHLFRIPSTKKKVTHV